MGDQVRLALVPRESGDAIVHGTGRVGPGGEDPLDDGVVGKITGTPLAGRLGVEKLAAPLVRDEHGELPPILRQALLHVL
jgi:hypothetical protein